MEGYPDRDVPADHLETRRRDRVVHGMRQRHNWWQLGRFTAVGASGYLVNLATFALCVHALNLDYRLAAVVAFGVAVTSNFWWNRHWTFDAKHGHAGFQAARFFTVSVLALVVNLIALKLLVGGGMSELPAQAISVAIAMPFNFIGNKLWTFDDV
jgi:putative flippase GtrA